jgi:hypothetical protein
MSKLCVPSLPERLPIDEDGNPIVPRPPLFSRTQIHRYDKYSKELEPIFTRIFPNWEPNCYHDFVLPWQTFLCQRRIIG